MQAEGRRERPGELLFRQHEFFALLDQAGVPLPPYLAGNRSKWD
jgi:hypothetical protein